jgi:hypothetical protein
MTKTDNNELMERVLSRLQAESQHSVTASTRQLTQATSQLIHDVRELNAAFSAPTRRQPRSVRSFLRR